MPPIAPLLKQRLGNLSLAPSAPSPPSNNPFSSLSLRPDKRRQLLNKFTPPWAKRPQSPLTHDYGEWDRLQDVMAKMIFQAGVDFETRPMVVINASALPDPTEVNYDLLLSRILSYLNLYVESDYTLVFFAAGGGHTPGWNWVWKAYRSLSRKYRKNLKQLYVVHTSFFTKMLFSLAGAIISPKFFRKIIHISTLSELATHVPLTQIDIPPAVYQENLKYENEITLPIAIKSSIFGVPLEELMGYHGEKGGVPRVVKDSIQFLRDSGLENEGLFRRSPSSAMLHAAQDAYDRGNVVSLNTFGDPFLAAVLIKKYLRDLPEPIFPEHLYPLIRRCPPPPISSDPLSEMAAITFIRGTLLPELVPCAYILLSSVLHLMHEVSLRASMNKMDAHNLTIVLCPNLIKGSSPTRDVMMCSIPTGTGSSIGNAHILLSSPGGSSPSSPSLSPGLGGGGGGGTTTLGMIIKLCIQRYYEIFDEVADRSEVVSEGRMRTLNGRQQVHSPPASPSPSPVISYHRPGPSIPVARKQGSRPILPTHLTHHGDEGEEEEEEEIDDTMLVMSVEPGVGPGKHKSNTSVQWARGVQGAGAAVASGSNGVEGASTAFGTSPSPPSSPPSSWAAADVKKRAGMAPAAPRSMHTDATSGGGGGGAVNGLPYPTMSKARSLINIDGSTMVRGKKGSIEVGRGTTRKSVGAGVEALGVTAEGFFAPPTK